MTDTPVFDSKHFAPPDKFSFDPRDWPKWKRRFDHYRELSGLDKQKDEFQIHALIYCMGEQADDIKLSFQLSDADAKKYTEVIKKFEEYYVGKRNVVYERALFGMRHQEDGETIESFVTALHTLSEHCEYGLLKESLVRDRIVLGVRDKQLSEKLMLTKDLTLAKAVEISKQWEMVKRQQGDLCGEGSSKNLDSIGKKYTPSRSQPKADAGRKKERTCKFCMKPHEFKKELCPAWGKICLACNKKNHFQGSVMCPMKASAEASELTGSVDKVFATPQETFMIGSVKVNSMQGHVNSSTQVNTSQRWKSTVSVDGEPIEFKLDPGADVTTMPYHLFRKSFRKRRLYPADIVLSACEGTRLQIVGTATCTLSHNGHTMKETIYVCKGLQQPLLGVGACESLQFVKRLDSVDSPLSSVVLQQEFPELFQGLGKMNQPYTIKLKPDAKPFAIHAPRRVPIPLMSKVKQKLDDMIAEGVIEAVDEPTEWCAPLVTAPKPGGDIRLCVDLTALNRSVEREFHPMPVVEHTLGQLSGAKIFSKLDANSGFYQILLSPECRNLTTFITPFGRYRYKRLPFGISSAPEHFQKRMMEILGDLSGVVIHIDDLLIYGSSKQEHDERLRAVLQRLKDAGVTLNLQKCVIGVNRVKFLGHIIDEHGVSPDNEKIDAIVNMPDLTSVAEVRRFLGMTNFIGRFIPNLSSISKPLYELTHLKSDFVWGPSQREAFAKIKKILTEEPSLALYDPNKQTRVSSDASSYGLGAVLLQKQDDEKWRPVAYASRTMTTAEQRYAQIEKECLGIVWACERFRDFLLGKSFVVETDHKPLLPILTTKCVDDLSPRLQRFRIRLMWYSFEMRYVPGKELVTADALSRSPLKTVSDWGFDNEVYGYVCHVMEHLPVTDSKLADIWTAQQEDDTITEVIQKCQEGWPQAVTLVTSNLRPFWNVRHELTVQHGLLLRNCRIVIPRKLREEILGKIHEGHMGIVKCRARARESCWWPGISEDIAEVVRRCPVCVMLRHERKEPMISSDFPSRPWQKLGMDLFMFQGRWFILVVDYFSRYLEVSELKSMSTAAVVNALKGFFSRHGIPEEVMSDNGPQFNPLSTSPFRQFAQEYGFNHVTSSPRYPQSNGFVENGVRIVKNLLAKNDDWYKGILEYRATPLSNGYSPAELLMGRRLRTTLPMVTQQLVPKEIDMPKLNEYEENRRLKQKTDYDKRHGVHEKEDFLPGELIWVKDLRSWGTVVRPSETPRSYIVRTDRGEYRRNSSHLTRAHTTSTPTVAIDVDLSDEDDDLQNQGMESIRNEPSNFGSPGPRRTASGRAVNRPRRLIEEI